MKTYTSSMGAVIVEQLINNKDGYVRACKLRITTTYINRQIAIMENLCPLEITHEP